MEGIAKNPTPHVRARRSKGASPDKPHSSQKAGNTIHYNSSGSDVQKAGVSRKCAHGRDIREWVALTVYAAVMRGRSPQFPPEADKFIVRLIIVVRSRH